MHATIHLLIGCCYFAAAIVGHGHGQLNWIFCESLCPAVAGKDMTRNRDRTDGGVAHGQIDTRTSVNGEIGD